MSTCRKRREKALRLRILTSRQRLEFGKKGEKRGLHSYTLPAGDAGVLESGHSALVMQIENFTCGSRKTAR
jgi:hypothetical protein